MHNIFSHLNLSFAAAQCSDITLPSLFYSYFVQHDISDVWQALGFVHASTDELEAQQKLPVVPLFLLWVNRLPMFCRGKEKRPMTLHNATMVNIKVP